MFGTDVAIGFVGPLAGSEPPAFVEPEIALGHVRERLLCLQESGREARKDLVKVHDLSRSVVRRQPIESLPLVSIVVEIPSKPACLSRSPLAAHRVVRSNLGVLGKEPGDEEANVGDALVGTESLRLI